MRVNIGHQKLIGWRLIIKNSVQVSQSLTKNYPFLMSLIVVKVNVNILDMKMKRKADKNSIKQILFIVCLHIKMYQNISNN